ncbi:hypothetical protein [Pontiella sp.]|uniref:hypothetical protein n=1 Tax=Pontiella sp. TaxID=2837462 RepID=UPI003564EA09
MGAAFAANAAPSTISLSPIATYESGIFDEGAAEIVAHDAASQRLFVSNADENTLDVLDISDPANPSLLNNRDFEQDVESSEAGDLGPEGFVFISAEDSPNGSPLLVVANEVSGTTTIYEVSSNK